MKSNRKMWSFTLLAGVVALNVTGLESAKASTSDEVRVAAVVEIPIYSGEQFFDLTKMRIGAKIQYASVEEDDITVIETEGEGTGGSTGVVVTEVSIETFTPGAYSSDAGSGDSGGVEGSAAVKRMYASVGADGVTITDRGNKAYGSEAYLFFMPFGDWKPSVEVMGFFGSNDVQGGFGGGYDWNSGWFLDTKIMMPYAEVGARFLCPFEIYVGGTTFGSFDPGSNTSIAH